MPESLGTRTRRKEKEEQMAIKKEDPAPKEPDTDEGEENKPSYMTSLEFNKAMTAREKRQEERFSKILQETVSSALAAVKPPVVEAAKAAEGSDPVKQELAALRGRLEEERKAREEEKRLREQERDGRLKEEARNAAASILRDNGIDGSRLKGALAVLDTEERRISRDESGSLRFKFPKNGYDDYVSLDEGIAAWLKTEDGKAYLPARQAGGSGNNGPRPGSNNRTGTRDKKSEETEAAKNTLLEILTSRY